MYNGLKYFLTFTLGAAAGAVVTWKLVKTTYERIAQEQIDAAYEEFCVSEPDVESENKAKENTYTAFDNLIKSEGYLNSLDSNEEKEGGSEPMHDDKPYVISADEFEEHDDYEIVCLTLYADGVLADMLDNVIEDVEQNIGTDYVNGFADSDTVYVQNDELRTYYEITRDTMKYTEVTGKSLTGADLNPTVEE